MVDIHQKRANRLRFLNELYEQTDGMRYKHVNFIELGTELGIEPEEVVDIVHYLIGEHLVEHTSGTVALSHYGIKEVEEARLHPTEPTEHFPPAVNIIQIASMVNSTIQQGSPGATQNVALSSTEIEAFRALLNEIRGELKKHHIAEDQRQDLEANLATIDSQLRAKQPKKGIVRESLQTIRNILEGIAGNAVANAIFEKYPELISFLF